MMTAHFVDIALRGWQFERFEEAWFNWLHASAKIDWTEERLHVRVESVLLKSATLPTFTKQKICELADKILMTCGVAFQLWMETNIEAGLLPTNFSEFNAPALESGGDAATTAAIAALLGERYKEYVEVSYWLRIVVDQLSNLHNTYPGATLHDCDDGSDLNPVRLNNTALGNYPLRSKLN
jgi:hypothetical protein